MHDTPLHDLLEPLLERFTPLPAVIGGVVPSARPVAVALAALSRGTPLVAVTASGVEAERLARDLEVFLGERPPLAADALSPHPYPLLLPARETSIFDLGLADAERLQTLYDLSAGQPVVLVAPLLAVLQPACDVEVMRPLRLRAGEALDVDEVVRTLARLGYTRAAVARDPGEVAVQGAVLDICPSNGHPLRAHLADGRLDRLRAYDAQSQRTTADVASADVLPVREPPGAAPLLAHLPPGAPLVLCDPDALAARLLQMREARERTSDVSTSGHLAVLEAGDPWEAWRALLDSVITVTEADAPDGLHSEAPPRFAGRLGDFAAHAGTLGRAWVVTRQARRVGALLKRRGLDHVQVVEGDLSQGLRIRDREVLSDRELFGHAAPSPRQSRIDALAPDLHEGDLVVHEERGIGRYDGLETVEVEDAPRDLLQLTYADDARLMVPVHQIDQVSRYLGDEDMPPRLTTLGKPTWQRTVDKVRATLDQAAVRLVEAQAVREGEPARPLRGDAARDDELEASFPYDETPDQRAAIEAIRADLGRPRPMDRLLCGDVGYGKTEVAVRAAFTAIASGAQVAVLVPTTVLAQQHEGTFTERLQPLGVRIASLTSGTSGEGDVLSRLAAGEIDLVVGTQRLLGDDVRLPHLGLVIVDEEQQLGLAEKEKLRTLSRGVHVLAMTATPIPRTMQLSLAGLRDVSVLETAPEARRPIRTYLLQDTPDTIRAALRRELERGGQAFLLHNRVQGLSRMAAQVRRLVPGARVSVAHGQMAAPALRDVLARFTEQEHDVLVCTTIIEAGVDMPCVNTMVVKDAHALGLGQLYQIRGRVGRAEQQGFCYLLHPPAERLTAKAHARLETLARLTALGSGHAIALRDLEIRGAGDLLGESQAGHVARVGFTLFCKLLDEALARARGQSSAGEAADALPIPAGAFVPQAYVHDAAQRVAIYRRLAEIRSRAQRQALIDELADRYGPLPPPLEMLLQPSS